jgi:hypothetical protein
LQVLTETTSPAAFSFPKLMISLYEPLSHREQAADEAFHLATTVAQQASLEALGNRIKLETLKGIAYDVLCRYEAVAGLQYGLRHRVIDPTSRKRLI